MKAERRQQQIYSSTLSLTSAIDQGGPDRFTPAQEIQNPFYGRMGGSQGRSGRVRKIAPPIGIRSADRPARSQSLYRLSYPRPETLSAALKTVSQSTDIDFLKTYAWKIII
jgi:hypothetical protein